MKQLVLIIILVALSSQSIVEVNVLRTTDLGPANPLQGKQYNIAYSNLEIQSINGVQVSFTEQEISFYGCNSNWANYQFERWQFQITGKWASTKKACEIDNDAKIRKLFADSERIQLPRQGRVDFFQGQTLLLTLDQKFELESFNRLAGKSLLIEQTILGIKKILGTQINFSETSISFTGCNSFSALYSVFTRNRFRVTSQWMSTLKFCQNDTDGLIAHLFSSSIYYSVLSNGGVSLFGPENKLLIHLGPKVDNLPKSPFTGYRYLIAQSSLNNNAVKRIEVFFTDKTISLYGCNYNKGAYVITNPNLITVDPASWVATLRACKINLDKSIIDLFTQSKSFKINPDNSASFFDQKSQLTLRLKIAPPPDIIIDPPFIPVALNGFPDVIIEPPFWPVVLRGVFKIKSNSLKEEINGVQVSFIRGRVSFSSCNSNFATYSTGENNSFCITSGWAGTYMFCKPDYDRLIQSLFNKSIRYQYKGTGFAFFDSKSKQLVEIQYIR